MLYSFCNKTVNKLKFYLKVTESDIILAMTKTFSLGMATNLMNVNV